MDKDFWLASWEENRIGFHESQPHPKLLRFIDRLAVPNGGIVFLPLCGKSVDFDWLLTQGYRATGAEFSEDAVKEVFDRNRLVPEVEEFETLKSYSAAGLTLFAGDIFDLTAEMLGPVDGVFDRAALVALPVETRRTYARHLAIITRCAPQLLVTFEYNQADMVGPPFAVHEDEVHTLYDAQYEIALLERKPLSGNLSKRLNGFQATWILTES